MNKIKFLLFVFVALILDGCIKEKEISNLIDFNGYMNKEKNGLIISRSVNGVKVTLNYLTPEYNALKEMELEGLKGKNKYDSLLTYYKSSASFVMTLAPDENKSNSGDIMYKGLKNFKEYIARAMSLNFDLESQVTLEANKNEYTPVLSSLDNTYSLTNDRKINFVFTPTNETKELINSEYYDFVYHDEHFDLGTLHFYFDKKKIENDLPEIIIQ